MRAAPRGHNKTALKTDLGQFVGFLFGKEIALLFVVGYLVSLARDRFFDVDKHNSPAVFDPFAKHPFECVVLFQVSTFVVVLCAWALPRDKMRLPPFVYASVLLHQEQGRAGPWHRVVIQMSKVLVTALAVLSLRWAALMPNRHHLNLMDDVRWTHEHDAPLWTVAAGFYLTFYDGLAFLWSFAAMVVLAYAVVMDFLLCFVWNHGGSGIHLGHGKKQMADMEEGRVVMVNGREAVPRMGRRRPCHRRIGEAFAKWGEYLMGFATWQYSN